MRSNGKPRKQLSRVHSEMTACKSTRRMMIYNTYRRNHVVLPGRENALEGLLKQEYKGIGRHSWANGFNSHSEDALTWSCFDLLSNLPTPKKLMALDEIFEDAYRGSSKLSFSTGPFQGDQIQIHVGKQYSGSSSRGSFRSDCEHRVSGYIGLL